jgi:hypothetical protein
MQDTFTKPTEKQALIVVCYTLNRCGSGVHKRSKRAAVERLLAIHGYLGETRLVLFV